MTDKEIYCMGRADYLAYYDGYSLEEGYKKAEKEYEENHTPKPTQKEITEYVMKNLDKMASTDLMQLSKIAKEIVDKRTKKCEADGLFG